MRVKAGELALYVMIAALVAVRYIVLPFSPPRVVVFGGIVCCVILLVLLRYEDSDREKK